jgi:hypothetical protein
VKEEIDRMLDAGIIEPVVESEWISPMVVQDKKTRGIRICVDLRKLNDACLHDPFPTPFTDEVLENVGGKEAYSFTDGFSGYHQIKIVQEDRYKTTFVTEWGSYQYTVMPFGLKNAPAIFSRVVVATFKEFIHKFLEVYLDDWTVFSLLKDHIEVLRLMLDRCRQCHISLNLKKCIFCAPFGILLGHVVCKQGIISGSYQDCSNSGFTTTYISQTTEGNSGSHRILQEILSKVMHRLQHLWRSC